MIELRVLGALDLRDGAGFEIGRVLAQPKRLALLVYLALSHDTQQRNPSWRSSGPSSMRSTPDQRSANRCISSELRSALR